MPGVELESHDACVPPLRRQPEAVVSFSSPRAGLSHDKDEPGLRDRPREPVQIELDDGFPIT